MDTIEINCMTINDEDEHETHDILFGKAPTSSTDAVPTLAHRFHVRLASQMTQQIYFRRYLLQLLKYL